MGDLELIAELEFTLAEINTQIDQLRHTANEMGIPVAQLRDKFGRYMVTDLLITKGQILHALVLVKS